MRVIVCALPLCSGAAASAAIAPSSVAGIAWMMRARILIILRHAAPANHPHVALLCRRLHAASQRVRGGSAGRPVRGWPVDDAREELFGDALQRTRPDQRAERALASPALDLLDRSARRARGPAAGGGRDPVRRHSVAERAVCLRPAQGGISAA